MSDKIVFGNDLIKVLEKEYKLNKLAEVPTKYKNGITTIDFTYGKVKEIDDLKYDKPYIEFTIDDETDGFISGTMYLEGGVKGIQFDSYDDLKYFMKNAKWSEKKNLKESDYDFGNNNKQFATDKECNMSGEGYILEGSYNFIMEFLAEWGIAPTEVKSKNGFLVLYNSDGHDYGYIHDDGECNIFIADKEINYFWKNYHPSSKRIKVKVMEESKKSIKESNAELKWTSKNDEYIIKCFDCHFDEPSGFVLYKGSNKRIEILFDDLNTFVAKGYAKWTYVKGVGYVLSRTSSRKETEWYSIYTRLYSLEPWGVIKESKKSAKRNLKENRFDDIIQCVENLLLDDRVLKSIDGWEDYTELAYMLAERLDPSDFAMDEDGLAREIEDMLIRGKIKITESKHIKESVEFDYDNHSGVFFAYVDGSDLSIAYAPRKYEDLSGWDISKDGVPIVYDCWEDKSDEYVLNSIKEFRRQLNKYFKKSDVDLIMKDFHEKLGI